MVRAPSAGVHAEPKRKSGDGAPLILVVDDELNARELIRNVLENAGYRVVTADSGAAALRAAREGRPDLITLDLLMPGGNGFGTLYELRLLYREEPPPVVIVSVVDDRATGFALGAADYLVKPVSKTDLLEAVRKHLPPTNAGLLIIDDDPAMLELAREAFSQPWIRLYVAASGREGLSVLESEAVDAVVLDLIMPQMDGFEFLKIMQSDSRLAHIPVSVLTSKDLSQGEMQQLRNQVQSIFIKNSEWKPGLIGQIARSLGRAKAESGLPA
jgi:DNA-binding response OmpR family regulator